MRGAATSPAELPVVRAAALASLPVEDRWLIETLWAQSGVGVIGGTPKSNKSWLGLEMAVSVATGKPCLDHFKVPHPGPALIYLAEDAAYVVRDRLDALCAHRRLSIDELDVRVITAPSLRLDLERDIVRLDRTLTAHRPRMLLLDPFVRLHRADENNAQDVSKILDSLRLLQRKHEVAVVVVHHSRKSGSRRQHGQALRGSGDLHAWGDSNLYLVHERQKLCLTMEHRAAPTPQPVYLELANNPPHLRIVDPPAQQAPSLQDRVVDELDKAQGPLGRTQLRQRLAVNNKRLGDALVYLEQLGRIERTPEGWRSWPS